MKEYYKDNDCKIYNTLAEDFLPLMPDKSVELVLTDPPYGVRKEEEWDNKDNFIKSVNGWLDQCLRVGKTVVWFCASKMMPYILSGREEQFHRLLIWNKPPGSQFAGAMHNNIWYSIEPILVFGESKLKNGKKKYGYSSFDYPTVASNQHNHPTTKPLGLMMELVYYYSEGGDTILDPFCGTGTVLEAAKRQGRFSIGVDADINHCNSAAKRLNQYEPLFGNIQI